METTKSKAETNIEEYAQARGLGKPREWIQTPGGRKVAACSDTVLFLWDHAADEVQSAVDLSSRFSEYDRITRMTFSPDGERLVACAGDKILIWDHVGNDSNTLHSVRSFKITEIEWDFEKYYRQNEAFRLACHSYSKKATNDELATAGYFEHLQGALFIGRFELLLITSKLSMSMVESWSIESPHRNFVGGIPGNPWSCSVSPAGNYVLFDFLGAHPPEVWDLRSRKKIRSITGPVRGLGYAKFAPDNASVLVVSGPLWELIDFQTGDILDGGDGRDENSPLPPDWWMHSLEFKIPENGWSEARTNPC